LYWLYLAHDKNQKSILTETLMKIWFP
jgi:hypothetical protein